jgi:hypothetical protein
MAALRAAGEHVVSLDIPGTARLLENAISVPPAATSASPRHIRRLQHAQDIRG